MKNPKVVQLSVVHFAHDPRVVFRTAATVAQHYHTTLIIPNADAQAVPGLHTVPLRQYRKLWQRLLFLHPLVLVRLLVLNPRLIHFHDPELIPLGLFFGFLGKIVVFDIHENIKKQLQNKTYNNNAFYKKSFYIFNYLAEKYLFLVFAEAHQAELYSHKKEPFAVTLNYPELHFYKPYLNLNRSLETNEAINLFYIGGISIHRCLDTMVQAVAILRAEYPNILLHLVGENTETQHTTQAISGYEEAKNNIIFYGKKSPKFGFELSKICVAGLSIIKPVGDYKDSYPTKTFEYMCVGLPVITSDLPHFLPIVAQNNAGFCVSPYDAQAVAQAIKLLIKDRTLAKKMGENGVKAAQERYNWQPEAEKLVAFYKKILEP